MQALHVESSLYILPWRRRSVCRTVRASYLALDTMRVMQIVLRIRAPWPGYRSAMLFLRILMPRGASMRLRANRYYYHHFLQHNDKDWQRDNRCVTLPAVGLFGL